MKVLLSVLTAGLLGIAAQSVQAADGAALAQKGGCVACHSADKKILGPSYKDVAAKYKGQKDAEEMLIKKVKAGGSGVWGPMPMPPNTGKLSDDEFKTVVDWILSL
jgi:cytochrome c